VHPGVQRRDRAGDLVVPDDVRAVQRHAVALGEVAHQAGGGAVHLLGVPCAALDRHPLVLDPDRVTVHVPVAGVPRHVLVAHHVHHGAVRRADQVVAADGAGGVAEHRHGGVVGDLGVVDHDVADVQPVVRPAGEVEVAVVARVLGVVPLVGGQQVDAPEVGRAVEGARPRGAELQRAGGRPVGGHRPRGQRDELAVAGAPGRAAPDRPVDNLGEVQRDRSLGGAGVARRRPVPVGEVRRGVPGRLVGEGGQQRRPAADVVGRVALQQLGVQAEQAAGIAQRGAGLLWRGQPLRRAVQPPAVPQACHRRVEQVHRAVAAGDARGAAVVLPAREVVGDRQQQRLRHAELARRVAEHGLERGRVRIRERLGRCCRRSPRRVSRAEQDQAGQRQQYGEGAAPEGRCATLCSAGAHVLSSPPRGRATPSLHTP
jgi:hypothetical protein